MAPNGMERLDARIASFAAVTRPKRLAKLAFPLTADEYPHLTPDELANAGFYHTPVDGEEDAVTCFMCPLALSGWDTTDNPHVEHMNRDKACAWKELVCALEVDRIQGGPGRLRTEFESADDLPSSEKRTALRLQTYGDWWPHTKPSAQELAAGGFISMPTKGAPDGTTCPLCRYALEEWEEGDDPLEVHRRKEPECPFFTATVAGAGKKKGTKKAPAKPKRATKAAVESEAEDVPKTKRATKAAHSTLQVDEEKEEPAPPKRRGRPPKASTASAAADTTVAEPEEVSAPKRRGRPPKASTVAAAAAADTSTASTTATKKPRAKRKTAAEKRAEAEAEAAAAAAATAAADNSLELPADEDPSIDILDVPPTSAPAPARATRSRSSSKAARPPPTVPVPVPAPVEEERQTKPLPRKGRSRKTTQNDEPQVPAETASRATRSAPAGKSARSARTSQSEVAAAPAEEEPPQPLTTLERFANSLAQPASPSVKHAVAGVVTNATGAPVATSAALQPDEKAMTLEEYVRKQFAVRHDELRAQGEAVIKAWESKAREGRSRIEKAFV